MALSDTNISVSLVKTELSETVNDVKGLIQSANVNPYGWYNYAQPTDHHRYWGLVPAARTAPYALGDFRFYDHTYRIFTLDTIERRKKVGSESNYAPPYIRIYFNKKPSWSTPLDSGSTIDIDWNLYNYNIEGTPQLIDSGTASVDLSEDAPYITLLPDYDDLVSNWYILLTIADGTELIFWRYFYEALPTLTKESATPALSDITLDTGTYDPADGQYKVDFNPYLPDWTNEVAFFTYGTDYINVSKDGNSYPTHVTIYNLYLTSTTPYNFLGGSFNLLIDFYYEEVVVDNVNKGSYSVIYSESINYTHVAYRSALSTLADSPNAAIQSLGTLDYDDASGLIAAMLAKQIDPGGIKNMYLSLIIREDSLPVGLYASEQNYIAYYIPSVRVDGL